MNIAELQSVETDMGPGCHSQRPTEAVKARRRGRVSYVSQSVLEVVWRDLAGS